MPYTVLIASAIGHNWRGLFHDEKFEEGCMDKLDKNPEQAAKDVVERAKKDYDEKNYKEFRYQVNKKFEEQG